MTYGSCHNRCESKLQTVLKPYCSASFARCTVRDAGGFGCSTIPKSIATSSDQVLTQVATKKAAIALRPEVLPAIDDALASREHGVDMAIDLVPLPRRVVHVHVVGLAVADRGVAV